MLLEKVNSVLLFLFQYFQIIVNGQKNDLYGTLPVFGLNNQFFFASNKIKISRDFHDI